MQSGSPAAPSDYLIRISYLLGHDFRFNYLTHIRAYVADEQRARDALPAHAVFRLT